MPQFVSPGAMAGNAIQQFLMQRELEKQQAMENEVRQQQAERQAQQQAAQLELQQQQESRIAAAQAQQQRDLETERGFRRATTIATSALPDDPVDGSTASLLREHGYGGQIRQGQPIQGPQIGEDEAGVPQYQVTPGILQMRGGSQYLSARAAEQARAAQAEETRLAREAEAERDRAFRAEQGDANRSLREELAAGRGGMSSLQEETAGLRNDLLRQQIEQKQTQIDQDRAWRDKTGEDAKRVTENALALAKRLKTHAGLGAATGAYELRGFTQGAQDFNGIRDQLVAALTLPNLGALKGPMSDKDIVFVKNLATRLANPKLSGGETSRAIDEAITFLQSKTGGQVAGGGGFQILSVED